MSEKRFQRVRETAKMPDFPGENTLRTMIKAGLIPGFFAGKRFYIDVPAAREVLTKLSLENATV